MTGSRVRHDYYLVGHHHDSVEQCRSGVQLLSLAESTSPPPGDTEDQESPNAQLQGLHVVCVDTHCRHRRDPEKYVDQQYPPLSLGVMPFRQQMAGLPQLASSSTHGTLGVTGSPGRFFFAVTQNHGACLVTHCILLWLVWAVSTVSAPLSVLQEEANGETCSPLHMFPSTLS